MLKSVRPSHIACHVVIQRYLELDEQGELRAVTADYLNIATPHARKHWARRMDKTRAAFGNDRPWGGAPAVTYQHFVISPSPRDDVGFDTLRDLAIEWAEKHFGDHEVALISHAANAAGERMPHMHVIVNNTNLATGRRLQISKGKSRRMKDDLQKMAEERGLRWFDNEADDGRTQQFAYRTREERALEKSGKYSFQQDLRNRIDVALRTTRTAADFAEELEALGVAREAGAGRDGGDCTYSLAGSPRRRSSGERLGAGYTPDGIAGRMDDARRGLGAPKSVPPRLRENVNAYLEQARVVATVPAHVTLAEVALVLKTNDRFGITAYGGYDKLLVSLGVRMSKTSDPDRLSALKRDYGDVAHAKKIAGQGRFFEGVPVSGEGAPEPAAGGGGSRRAPGGGAGGGTRGSAGRGRTGARPGRRDPSRRAAVPHQAKPPQGRGGR